jgi:hypothetical protein
MAQRHGVYLAFELPCALDMRASPSSSWSLPFTPPPLTLLLPVAFPTAALLLYKEEKAGGRERRERERERERERGEEMRERPAVQGGKELDGPTRKQRT